MAEEDQKQPLPPIHDLLLSLRSGDSTNKRKMDDRRETQYENSMCYTLEKYKHTSVQSQTALC
jgi:hypothetical protein